MKLTDLGIKALAMPEKNSVIYSDDALTGFGVRVTEKGVKSFVLTHGVRRQRETIGRVGVVSLQEARAEAKRRLAEYTLGKTKPATTTWSAALTEYLDGVKAKRKPRTYVDYDRILKSHFKFGDMKFSALTHADLQKKLDKIADRPTEQHHAYAVLRAFVRWAHHRDYLDRNPMEKMRSPDKYSSRERILTDVELAKVWKESGDDTFGKIVKLLILTGQRVGEIKSLHRTMLGNDTITLPDWLTKNGREHAFPVGKMAQPFLKGNGLLFPARGKKTPFNGFSKCKAKLEKRVGFSDWTLHDLRRTLRSKWAELGVLREVAEKYINHISGVHSGVEGIYDRYRYMPEMKAAVLKWEQHLTKLTAPVKLLAA